MRSYSEPTARNLLRRPLLFGVPMFGLIGLASIVLCISVLFGTNRYGNLIAAIFAVFGYALLRVLSRFAKSGWEEQLIFWLESHISVKSANGKLTLAQSNVELSPPDSLDEVGLIHAKEDLLETVTTLKPEESLILLCQLNEKGAVLSEVKIEGRFNLANGATFDCQVNTLTDPNKFVYSLYQLPVVTDPLWLFSTLSKINCSAKVVIRVKGISFLEIKRRIEVARRSSAPTVGPISDIDADVTFSEASTVLKGLSRGDESVVELSLIICADRELSLDEDLFCLEKKPTLAVLSALGVRPRFHRSHFVRAVTACDLIPNLIDPFEEGPSILRTFRGKPLYFSPNDPRLEALHWLVVGASGSGKSFFTGLVLKRILEAGNPMSVIFIDHNRSFRRLVQSARGTYIEPQNLSELESGVGKALSPMRWAGGFSGIELSDLSQDEKKAGTRFVLEALEAYLRYRDSIHPIYVVLDECWNFMRDEPVLVQRAFREFRKLNGAAVAITQSLSDFLTDKSGQSIFQNAPIRVLLRQGEDLAQYSGVLGLNSVELSKVRALRQKKGSYSECLIKTPFLSRIGRLYPTPAEHALLRTDNLRDEMVAIAKKPLVLAERRSV